MQEPEFNFSLAPETLRKQVEDKIRQAIVSGHFRPGLHLSERLMCDMFQVSRAVIREAVRQLEAEGLIETLVHRGSFVRSTTPEEAAQVYDVRCVLEALTARTFARRASEAEIRELRAAFEAIKRQAVAGRTGDLLPLKHQFYEVMLRGAGNDYVTRMMHQILNRNTLLRATTLSDPDRLPRTLVEIERIVAAIEARNEDVAWAATYEHVQHAADVAIAVLRRQAQKAAPSIPPAPPARLRAAAGGRRARQAQG